MDLNIHSPLPARKDFRIGILGSGFIVNDCHLVAYRKAGFNPVAIASRTRSNAERVARRHHIAKVWDRAEQLYEWSLAASRELGDHLALADGLYELALIRRNLMDRLEETAKAFRDECLAVHNPYHPLEPGGWNVHQIAAHTRDVDQFAYGLRVRRTALEENPEFPIFDGETYMAQHYNAQEPLNELLSGFVQSVEALAKLLRSLPPEAWSRVSRHTTLGRGLTLQSWVEKNLAHIKEHLEEVRKSKTNSEIAK